MRKNLLRAAAPKCASSLIAAQPCAQPYPNKPTRLLIPFAPGGGTDILARITPEQWAQFIKSEIEKWTKIARIAGVKSTD